MTEAEIEKTKKFIELLTDEQQKLLYLLLSEKLRCVMTATEVLVRRELNEKEIKESWGD